MCNAQILFIEKGVIPAYEKPQNKIYSLEQ